MQYDVWIATVLLYISSLFGHYFSILNPSRLAFRSAGDELTSSGVDDLFSISDLLESSLPMEASRLCSELLFETKLGCCFSSFSSI